MPEFFTHGNLCGINVCCFKMLSLWSFVEEQLKANVAGRVLI
jgi:hypothetical protein